MLKESAAFQVSLPGVGSGEDLLGVWQARPLRPEIAVSAGQAFAAPHMEASGAPPGVAGAEASLWQVDLPGDALASGSLLGEQERRMAQAEQALPEANRRLERYLALRSRGAGSFSIGKTGGPEAMLDGWIGAGGAASFGWPAMIPQGWEETSRQANALFKQLGQAAAYSAWIETSVSGMLVGRTTVGWSGDLRHFWLQGAVPEQATLHQRCLRLALRSRLAWIKMILLVLSGGLKLAALAPAGPVAGIPAALQFIRQVIAEAQELRAIQTVPAR